jgi:hypothetical protein
LIADFGSMHRYQVKTDKTIDANGKMIFLRLGATVIPTLFMQAIASREFVDHANGLSYEEIANRLVES